MASFGRRKHQGTRRRAPLVRILLLLIAYCAVCDSSSPKHCRWNVSAPAAEVVVSTPPAEVALVSTQHNEHRHNTPSLTPKDILRQFVREHQPSSVEQFKVQGWRWHTMSLIREARRLSNAAAAAAAAVPAAAKPESQQSMGATAASPSKPVSSLATPDLATAVQYVVEFNLRGLHKIQNDLFFPWVRQHAKGRLAPEIVEALGNVLDELQGQGHLCCQLGQALQHHEAARRHSQVHKVAQQLVDTASDMLQTENTLLVPLVAQVIPTRLQEAFNNQVIRSLGIWDSRLHLVAMHEAVRDQPDEVRIFQQTIPYLPRSMLPRWKRKLYDPQVAALESF